MITASVMKELIYSINKQRSGKVVREKSPALWQYLSQNKYFQRQNIGNQAQMFPYFQLGILISFLYDQINNLQSLDQRPFVLNLRCLFGFFINFLVIIINFLDSKICLKLLEFCCFAVFSQLKIFCLLLYYYLTLREKCPNTAQN